MAHKPTPAGASGSGSSSTQPNPPEPAAISVASDIDEEVWYGNVSDVVRGTTAAIAY